MKKIISTEKAPKAIGPYNQAVEANGMLFISGQIPLNSSIGKIVEGGITEQTEQVMKNIAAILQEAELDFSNVVKCTCILADMADFTKMNEVYGRYFPNNSPARAAFAVKKLPLDVLIEIECIAVC